MRMNDDTILILAAAGIGIYALNKSGLFDATNSVASAIDGVGQGVSSAIGGVGQGISTVGRETGETVSAILDPFQAASRQVTRAIDSFGRGSAKPGFYPGSSPGTIEMSSTQIDKLLRSSGVSTMNQVQKDIKNVDGTFVSPLFVGGSYTPKTATQTISTPKVSSPPTSRTRSSLIRTPRAGGGYTITGASNIKLR